MPVPLHILRMELDLAARCCEAMRFEVAQLVGILRVAGFLQRLDVDRAVAYEIVIEFVAGPPGKEFCIGRAACGKAVDEGDRDFKVGLHVSLSPGGRGRISDAWRLLTEADFF